MIASANNDREFYIVDFDRTLADTDKLNDVFFAIVEQYAIISRQELKKADEDVKRQGDSFDTAGYVRDKLRDSGRSHDWQRLEKQYIHESHSLNMLLPGAAELLAYFASHDLRYGILTYGNPLWQRLKLAAAGFNHVPRIIMTNKEKGRLVRSWQQPDKTFVLPSEFGGGVADVITMIDDKAVSFGDFPYAPSRGYWVLDSAHELPSQQGSVPSNVIRLTALTEVMDFIQTS